MGHVYNPLLNVLMQLHIPRCMCMCEWRLTRHGRPLIPMCREVLLSFNKFLSRLQYLELGPTIHEHGFSDLYFAVLFIHPTPCYDFQHLSSLIPVDLIIICALKLLLDQRSYVCNSCSQASYYRRSCACNRMEYRV